MTKRLNLSELISHAEQQRGHWDAIVTSLRAISKDAVTIAGGHVAERPRSLSASLANSSHDGARKKVDRPKKERRTDGPHATQTDLILRVLERNGPSTTAAVTDLVAREPEWRTKAKDPRGVVSVALVEMVRRGILKTMGKRPHTRYKLATSKRADAKLATATALANAHHHDVASTSLQ
jgi:hypothetical protein